MLLNKLILREQEHSLNSSRDRLLHLLDCEEAYELGWRNAEIGKIEFEGGNKADIIYVDDGDRFGIWKTPLFAGLIINQIARKNINEYTQCIVDAGGVSTAYCLNQLSRKTDKDIKFVTSRYYPRDLLKRLIDDKLELIVAPEVSELSIEEEFYSYLLTYIKQEKASGINISSPFHVKWSNYVSNIYADKLIGHHGRYFEDLDYMVVTVGSGATLGMALKIKSVYNNIRIIVAEPREAPLVSIKKGMVFQKELRNINSKYDYLTTSEERISHLTFGPHYEKLNSRIPNQAFSYVDDVITYSTENWQEVSQYMRQINMPVGNSTAASLWVAGQLQQNSPKSKILTVIYEPLRSYCLKEEGDA